jgi:hypothetical protein
LPFWYWIPAGEIKLVLFPIFVTTVRQLVGVLVGVFVGELVGVKVKVHVLPPTMQGVEVIDGLLVVGLLPQARGKSCKKDNIKIAKQGI